jgi:hypothetical protein
MKWTKIVVHVEKLTQFKRILHEYCTIGWSGAKVNGRCENTEILLLNFKKSKKNVNNF